MGPKPETNRGARVGLAQNPTRPTDSKSLLFLRLLFPSIRLVSPLTASTAVLIGLDSPSLLAASLRPEPPRQEQRQERFLEGRDGQREQEASPVSIGVCAGAAPGCAASGAVEGTALERWSRGVPAYHRNKRRREAKCQRAKLMVAAAAMNSSTPSARHPGPERSPPSSCVVAESPACCWSSVPSGNTRGC